MAEQQSSVRSSYAGRDASPDSFILTPESKFSSASVSVDRSSFASDSLSSELSLRLAGHENESWSGPDLGKVEQLKVRKEENDAAHKVDRNQLVDSARNSFSLALKDCQDRRTRLLKLPITSLDLNNVFSSSPRLEIMKKSSVAPRISGGSPSPGTPNYHNRSNAAMHNKGLNSERMPFHSNGVKRQQGNAAAGLLLPCNNGKILPSKWEDAERWIFSPVSGDSISHSDVRQSIVHPQRRPKSKSGPLGPPGTAYNPLCSPSTYIFDGGDLFSANGLATHSCSHGGGFAVRAEPCMARSVSVHGCSEAVTSPPLPSRDADENLDTVKDAATDSSLIVSRRDMATQMSPHGSTRSSKGSASLSLLTPSALPIMELQGTHSSKLDVRDVQIDERITMTNWSKKHRAGNTGNSSAIVDDWRKGVTNTRTLTWDVTETDSNISQINREEAKITAWENLQKAKAEAAIRKLEMKLEKKRSSSMDKIMNKLRSAQKRAQEMRHSMLSDQAHQVTRTSHKAISFCRARQMGSLSGCFTCHAL